MVEDEVFRRTAMRSLLLLCPPCNWPLLVSPTSHCCDASSSPVNRSREAVPACEPIRRSSADTFQDDWRAQAPGSTVTPADIDTNYQNIINAMQNGTFATKGSVLLAHQSSECQHRERLPFRSGGGAFGAE